MTYYDVETNRSRNVTNNDLLPKLDKELYPEGQSVPENLKSVESIERLHSRECEIVPNMRSIISPIKPYRISESECDVLVNEARKFFLYRTE